MNAITGELLKDLFETEPWQDLFSTLSESLGFSLTVYTSTGRPLFPVFSQSPCHNLRSASPDVASRCRSSCASRIMHTLETGKPEVFTCSARIMSFALPVAYLEDHAVIFGQGSFPSYEDFRESMSLVTSVGIDALPIKVPLSFTGHDQAWKACRFVDDTVTRLLTNLAETVSLRKKFESLMSVFSLWGSATADGPEMRYKDMLDNLSTLLGLDHITILALDRSACRYVSLYGLSKSGAQTESFSLGASDRIVGELIEGKPFVRSIDPTGTAIRYYFPVQVNRTLGGILCIADRVLTDSDQQIISGFCKQTALFIENHQLHQDLCKKLNRFAAMSELTRAITPTQNYGTLLQMILDKSAELLKAEQGSLMMIDDKTDALLLEAKKGLVEGIPDNITIRRGEGIAGRVVQEGEPILVQNVESDPRTRQKNRQHYKTRSFVSVPLKIADRVVGVLNLSDKTTGEVFDEEDLRLIQSFATQATVVMERNEYYNKSEELKKLTITDSLTGLLNRRYLLERLKDEVARSERHAHSLALLMLDLDGFKHCNDTRGHLFGDRILKTVAEILLGTVRSIDVVARFGGDEFLVILPETSETIAFVIGERLRNNIADKTLLIGTGAVPGPDLVTASIGIACYPQHGKTVENLLEHVDKALYRAKHKGKNTVEVYA